eukprot:3093989-Prymnesium_polylepis.1
MGVGDRVGCGGVGGVKCIARFPHLEPTGNGHSSRQPRACGAAPCEGRVEVLLWASPTMAVWVAGGAWVGCRAWWAEWMVPSVSHVPTWNLTETSQRHIPRARGTAEPRSAR